MGLLFIKTLPVKQYSYQNDFSGVFDALHQNFLVQTVSVQVGGMLLEDFWQEFFFFIKTNFVDTLLLLFQLTAKMYDGGS